MAEKKKRLFRNLFRIILLLSVIGMLAIIGFAGGVYLKLIDVQKIVSELKLTQQPLLVKYFPRLVANFEPVELETDKSDNKNRQPEQVALPKETAAMVNANQKPLSTADPRSSSSSDDAKTVSTDTVSTPPKVNPKLEETKRIARLARLYGNMKPDEAVNILSQLNDFTVVAILGKMEEEQVSKVLAMFEPKRAARLTELMLKGTLSN